MILLLLLACAAGLDLGRATTLEPGVSRIGTGTELQLLRIDQRPGEATFPAPWIQVTAGWHLGLPKDWEVGARAWGMAIPYTVSSVGLAVDAKHLVHRSGGKAGPHIAVGASAWWHAPSLGGAWWHVGGLTLPVFLGYDIKRSQLVLTPRVVAALESSYGQAPVSMFALGAGVAWDLAVGKRLHVTPEVAWTWSPLGFDGEVQTADRTGARNFETGIGISWETGGR